MGIGRAGLACVILGLTASSIAACALLVGPVDGRKLFETDADQQALDDVSSVEASEAEASPLDAPSEDQASADVDAWGIETESAAPEASFDVWSEGGCQPPPNNLIANGDFSQGVTYWALVNGGSGASIIAPDGGPLCIQTAASNATIFAWTKGVPLSPDAYDFWYCAWTSEASISIYPVVGHSTYPNTQDYSGNIDTVTPAGGKQDHPFALDAGDDSGGLSFSFTSPVDQQVCFQAVSLTVTN